jgi:PAS domain S-box-containing protein
MQEQDRAGASAATRRSLGFDQAFDALLAWDWKGPVTDWNRGAERLYGISRAAAIGRSRHELLQTSTVDGMPALSDALERDGVWQGELEHRVKDCAPIVVQARMLLTHDDEGRFVVEANRDLSAAKRAAQQLLRLGAELDAFGYGVSHDLRAPLRAMTGFAEIVVEEFGPRLPADGQRYLEWIRDGGRQTQLMLDGLLEFSRLGRQSMTREAVDMRAVLQAVLDEAVVLPPGRLIEWHVGAMPPCIGDPGLLRRVLANLIENAIKYTRGRAPAIIEIGCNCADGDNVYFVRDNGAGFDMRYAYKLFGMFQRLHPADDFAGIGTGLAIAQRIVHRLGGRVWADAMVGKGATFKFTLARAITAA